MANIHPNDIGLATYADVGNVERLRTTAKTVVEAINELYQSGGGGSISGDQIYVDGENNYILGKNNVVSGSNNLVIGSNNIVAGNNVNLVGSNKRIFKQPNNEFSVTSIDEEGTKYNLTMAACCLSVVPVFLVFLFGQKFFIKGLITGSVKG